MRGDKITEKFKNISSKHREEDNTDLVSLYRPRVSRDHGPRAEKLPFQTSWLALCQQQKSRDTRDPSSRHKDNIHETVRSITRDTCVSITIRQASNHVQQQISNHY
jgi:hypothetical protein